ncbi:MAG TPA: type II toxin-antitoxin system VapB family antitoxin [Bryobacteraceae bacterium]
MALNIKNPEVERLAGELARLTHKSKTEVIRQALLQQKENLMALEPGTSRSDRLREFLKFRVWPTIPAEARRPWTKEEEEQALGYGDSGEFV